MNWTVPIDQPGRRVFWILFGFFSVVLAANGALIFFAFNSWSGFTDSEVHSDDFSYNQVLERTQTQKALGWSAGLELTAAGGRNRDIAVNIKGPDGRGLAGADVRARFFRPTTVGYDAETVLKNSGAGRYTGTIELPLAGQWDVRIFAERDGQTSRWTTRIEIPQ